MGCVHLVLAALALAGEPPADHVLVDVRMVVPDALTGQGKVVSEPKVITQAGRSAQLRVGGTKLVTGDDGTDREVALGLTVEVLPAVSRTPEGVRLTLKCVVTHTISSPDGVVTRTVRRELTAASGERQVLRLAGEGHHAPLVVVITPRLVGSLESTPQKPMATLPTVPSR